MCDKLKITNSSLGKKSLKDTKDDLLENKILVFQPPKKSQNYSARPHKILLLNHVRKLLVRTRISIYDRTFTTNSDRRVVFRWDTLITK